MRSEASCYRNNAHGCTAKFNGLFDGVGVGEEWVILKGEVKGIQERGRGGGRRGRWAEEGQPQPKTHRYSSHNIRRI
jgi:hypothetical protein